MKKPPLLRLLPVFALTAAALALNSCLKKAEPTTEDGRRKILIGFIGKSLSNDVFQAAESGARDAAKALSVQHNVDVEIEVRTPNDEDATKQAEAIEALTRSGAAGIAVACSEANTVTPSIDKAVARGVAVMCFDSDAPESKRFAFYGADDRVAGAAIMTELARVMGEQGTVAILAGNQSALNLQNRTAGAKEALAKHAGMKLNEPGVFYHVETPEKAAEAVQNAQNANSGIQGWAFVGGWPLFTVDALKWAPGTVNVVSCDALPAQLNYVRSGHVETLFAQDCYGWGAKSVEIIFDKVINDKMPADVRLIDPLTRVTKENVDAFAGNWDKWLGKK